MTKRISIVISNAGVDAANGIYTKDERGLGDGGRRIYVNEEADHDITYYPASTPYGPAWYIQQHSGALGCYVARLKFDARRDMHCGLVPPVSGWEVYDGNFSLPGVAPVPRVEITQGYEPCSPRFEGGPPDRNSMQNDGGPPGEFLFGFPYTPPPKMEPEALDVPLLSSGFSGDGEEGILEKVLPSWLHCALGGSSGRRCTPFEGMCWARVSEEGALGG